MEQTKIYGMILLQEDGRLEVATDFSLNQEEEKTIKGILQEHRTEGGSIIGIREEIIEEYLTPKFAGNLVPITGEGMTVRELKKFLEGANEDATIAVASGYRSFPISGGFIIGGEPSLESETLVEYLEEYSME